MPDDAHASGGVDRRQFLHTALSGALVGIAARSGIPLPSAPGTANLSPGTALQRLLAGNRRFAADQLTSRKDDLISLRAQTLVKQHPFAAVLACADSRVPVELIFDQSIGQIFAVRVAGNVVTPEIIASLEYAVAELGIRALLVLGHTSCGAVKATMKADSAPGQVSALYPHIRPAVDQSRGNVDRAVELNARWQAELLRSSSTVIGQGVAAGSLEVVAAVYDLATGKVTVS